MSKFMHIGLAALILIFAGCAWMGGGTTSAGGVAMSGISAAGGPGGFGQSQLYQGSR